MDLFQYIEKTDLFIDRMEEAYNKCCPIRSKTITNMYIRSPSITTTIINPIRTKSNYLNHSNKANYYRNQFKKYYNDFFRTHS